MIGKNYLCSENNIILRVHCTTEDFQRTSHFVGYGGSLDPTTIQHLHTFADND